MKLFLQMVFIFCYIHACLRRLFHKSFCAIGKHNIGIGYENQRCLTALADLFNHRKHLVRRHTAGQSTQVGSLDHRTFLSPGQSVFYLPYILPEKGDKRNLHWSFLLYAWTTKKPAHDKYCQGRAYIQSTLKPESMSSVQFGIPFLLDLHPHSQQLSGCKANPIKSTAPSPTYRK